MNNECGRRFFGIIQLIILFSFVSSCAYKENEGAFLKALSDMAYGNIIVYEQIDSISHDGDVDVSKRILSKSAVAYAGLLMEHSVSIDSLPVTGKTALCYLSGNYDEILSNFYYFWKGDAAAERYLFDIKEFLDANNAEIMSYTKYAKYAEDKSDCRLPKMK